jgi:hypothetical protein
MAYPEDLTDEQREIIGREMREDAIDNWVTGVVANVGVDGLETKIAIIKSSQPVNPYDEMRRRKYPAIGDQLDDLYHKGAFSDEMAAKLQAVKDANPKPE